MLKLSLLRRCCLFDGAARTELRRYFLANLVAYSCWIRADMRLPGDGGLLCSLCFFVLKALFEQLNLARRNRALLGRWFCQSITRRLSLKLLRCVESAAHDVHRILVFRAATSV